MPPPSAFSSAISSAGGDVIAVRQLARAVEFLCISSLGALVATCCASAEHPRLLVSDATGDSGSSGTGQGNCGDTNCANDSASLCESASAPRRPRIRKQLRVRYCEASPASAELLSKMLAGIHGPSLVSLALRAPGPDPGITLAALVDAAPQFTGLEVLGVRGPVRGAPLRDKAVCRVATAVRAIPTLRRLSLPGIDVTRRACRALGDALSSAGLLERVEVPDAQLTPSGWCELIASAALCRDLPAEDLAAAPAPSQAKPVPGPLVFEVTGSGAVWDLQGASVSITSVRRVQVEDHRKAQAARRAAGIWDVFADAVSAAPASTSCSWLDALSGSSPGHTQVPRPPGVQWDSMEVGSFVVDIHRDDSAT